MSDQLSLFELDIKGNRIERISGRSPSKLRLTGPTILSLRKNISENLLPLLCV